MNNITRLRQKKMVGGKRGRRWAKTCIQPRRVDGRAVDAGDTVNMSANFGR